MKKKENPQEYVYYTTIWFLVAQVQASFECTACFQARWYRHRAFYKTWHHKCWSLYSPLLPQRIYMYDTSRKYPPHYPTHQPPHACMIESLETYVHSRMTCVRTPRNKDASKAHAWSNKPAMYESCCDDDKFDGFSEFPPSWSIPMIHISYVSSPSYHKARGKLDIWIPRAHENRSHTQSYNWFQRAWTSGHLFYKAIKTQLGTWSKCAIHWAHVIWDM